MARQILKALLFISCCVSLAFAQQNPAPSSGQFQQWVQNNNNRFAQNTTNTTVIRELPSSVVTSPSSVTVVKDQQPSVTVIKDQPASSVTVLKDQPSSSVTVVKDQPNSSVTVVKDQPAAPASVTVVKNQPTVAVVEQPGAAFIAYPNILPPFGGPPKTRVRQPRRPISYEENRQIMLDTAPTIGTPPTQDSVDAFNGLLQQNMPLSPQQVVQLRQQIDLAQRAAAIPPVIPPKPVSSTIIVNLAPGTTPPAIRLAQGYVSSLVFVDSTGSPWPIAAFDIGDPRSVNIQWDGKSNVLLMQAVTPYSSGNMVIRLVGLPTPITLEIISGQRVVDYRVDLHVSGIGPNTKELPIGTALPNGANVLLLSILDGIAPAGSRALAVHGADAQAWLLGDKLFLRSRLTVLSPGWTSTMVSPDGMHAYELPMTSSILVSRYGEPAEIRIEGL